MSLIIRYALKCDMCGDVRELDDKGEKDIWSHQLPVLGNGDIHYELMDLCPQCLMSVMLRPVTVNGETRYARIEDEC